MCLYHEYINSSSYLFDISGQKNINGPYRPNLPHLLKHMTVTQIITNQHQIETKQSTVNTLMESSVGTIEIHGDEHEKSL
jgi:hypothetical protein